jgi:hypothetical protein
VSSRLLAHRVLTPAMIVRRVSSSPAGPSARHRRLGRRVSLLLASLAGIAALAALTVAGTAQATVDISGTWDCCGAGGAGAQDFVITKGTGSLAGTGINPAGGAVYAKITGELSGDKVKIVTSYTGGSSYVATFIGTVAASGRTMSGTWKSNAGQSGTWTATLASTPSTPTPVLAESVAATTVSGGVLVEEPGTHTFVPLTKAGLVPVGATVNATNGRVAITAAGASAGSHHAGQFYGGEFRLTQARSGLTNLTLTGGVACAASARLAAKQTTRLRKQQLWGTGHGGSFETSGRYAAATVLGTRWLTKDTCTGTLVRVVSGEVRVTDLVTHRTLTLHAPQSFLAKP